MEPKVNVGILWDKKISFILNSDYLCNGHIIKGEYAVCIENGKIKWNSNLHEQLLFEPQNTEASFTLKDVVIGINFHWERKENQQFRGALKLIPNNGLIYVINILPIEDYLTSVISSEMSATASLELLKAHAVISRSWLLAQIYKTKKTSGNGAQCATFTKTENEVIYWYDREDHTLFDVCADDHCQRYQGMVRASANLNIVKQAITETRGQILMSGGEICDARYSKCCGGVVEEYQNAWEDVRYSYLVKLRDSGNSQDFPDLTQEDEAQKWILSRPPAFCNTQDKRILAQVLNNYDQETTDFYRWKIEYNQAELSALVNKRSGIDFGTITDLIPIERGTSGRLVKLKIIGTKKTMTIGKELEIRRILSTSHLYSSAFIVEKKESSFILHGAGWGHGVGLCQIGAAVMGEKGYNFRQILQHYYVGAAIEKRY
ncbi:SpoIID/LytB domain-containing protein [Dysgonomonas sp. 216]|uniref:SpoIID/LytB domain-containing protein n=1 Tax=Dysgonomonas sp. 216 TaxID=2302934 RepID=UPI0013D37A5F|nr:SpoIID/LytB domain-containing protein [Dysgonomonas sp. 216]NDW19848.1 SpoIID/LytB domain-containing protein [Dysgonomonas sp. 216]